MRDVMPDVAPYKDVMGDVMGDVGNGGRWCRNNLTVSQKIGAVPGLWELKISLRFAFQT